MIKRPELLFSDEFSSAIEEKSLSKLQLPTLNKLTIQAQQRIDEIEKDIETQEQHLFRYQEFLARLETAKEQKAQKEPSRKSAGAKKEGRNPGPVT